MPASKPAILIFPVVEPRTRISASLTAPKRLALSPASRPRQPDRPVSPPFPAHLHKSTSENLPKPTCAFNRVLLADPGAGRVIGCGKKILGCKAIKGHYLASKAGEFRQMGLDLSDFSMQNQSEPDSGFFGGGLDPGTGIRARFRRILVWGMLPPGARFQGRGVVALNPAHAFPGLK